MGQLHSVHAKPAAVSPPLPSQLMGLVGRHALVQGRCADCPDHFELRMVAHVTMSMAAHQHGAVAGAEPGEGRVGMLGGVGESPSCPEMQGYPGQGGVGLQGPTSYSLHSKQSLPTQQEHPALHQQHEQLTRADRGKKLEVSKQQQTCVA